MVTKLTDAQKIFQSITKIVNERRDVHKITQDAMGDLMRNLRMGAGYREPTQSEKLHWKLHENIKSGVIDLTNPPNSDEIQGTQAVRAVLDLPLATNDEKEAK